MSKVTTKMKHKSKLRSSEKENGQAEQEAAKPNILEQIGSGIREITDSFAFLKNKPGKDEKKKKRIPRENSEAITLARKVLRGEKWTVKNLILLYQTLKKENHFNYARKILKHLRENPELFKDKWLCQEHARCTYKDESIPADTRYSLAIEVLRSVFDLETTTDLRTLGLLGDIYKGKWSYDNQNENLERSLMYFSAGNERWLELMKDDNLGDNGYCAINAAFVLDLIATSKITSDLFIHEKEAGNYSADRAKAIRQDIIKHLCDRQGKDETETYRINVTIAEAYFGLYQYKLARRFLKGAKEIANKEGFLSEYASTAQQLATIAEIQIKMFKNHDRYQPKYNVAFQKSVKEILKKAQQIPRSATIVSFFHLLYFLLGKNCPESTDLKLIRNFKDKESFSSNLEELGFLCINYFDAFSLTQIPSQEDSLMKLIKAFLDGIKPCLSQKMPYRELKNYVEAKVEELNFSIETDSHLGLLKEAISHLQYFPFTIKKHFPVSQIYATAESIQSSVKQMNELQTQLTFKLSIDTLVFIHKYGYARYARMIWDFIGHREKTKTTEPGEQSRQDTDEQKINEVKNAEIRNLMPFGVRFFSHRDQDLYKNFMIELNYVLANNKLTNAELETLKLHTKKILTAAVADQLEEDARKELYIFTNDNSAVDTAFKGKVGIALSGGGFRASLYHIGVLAKLAELDILRHVEVISCVSGGSIIGAFYYLKLKHLLENNLDNKITREDYIRLVKEVETEFLEGVQKNIRMRLLDDPWYNIQMFFFPKKTRSARLAYLYEKYFYRKLFYDENDPNKNRKIPMRELTIKPKMEPPKEGEIHEEFNIDQDNWQRKNKVPELILNATSLNTGHNWQFTATWMGEPSASIVSEVDAKYRLRRMHYYEAPKAFREISLGEAVAASSGVPGAFEPLEFDNLYPDLKVQLVDGGVHDNQGVVGLLERECKIFFVSDASGQVLSQDVVTPDMLPVILRTNEVLQGRIREAQYLTLKSRNESALLKAMMFVHLRKDLSEPPKNWKFCQDPSEFEKSALSGDQQSDLTKYGIRTEIQKRLASVRTDLDSFNDIEAFALMYSGYKMTELEHRTTTQQFFQEEFQPEMGWNFLKIKEYTENVEKSKQLESILDVSSNLTFKVFHLSKLWRYIAFTFLAIVSAGLAYLLYTFWDLSFSIGGIAVALLIFLLPVVVGQVISYVRDYQGSIRSIAQKITIAIFGAAVSKLFVGYFNDRYNALGSLPIQNRNYLANLYLGILILIVGLVSWNYNWDFDNPWSISIKDHSNEISTVNVPMNELTSYCSIGLMGLGFAFLVYFIWTIFTTKKRRS